MARNTTYVETRGFITTDDHLRTTVSYNHVYKVEFCSPKELPKPYITPTYPFAWEHTDKVRKLSGDHVFAKRKLEELYGTYNDPAPMTVAQDLFYQNTSTDRKKMLKYILECGDGYAALRILFDVSNNIDIIRNSLCNTITSKFAPTYNSDNIEKHETLRTDKFITALLQCGAEFGELAIGNPFWYLVAVEAYYLIAQGCAPK